MLQAHCWDSVDISRTPLTCQALHADIYDGVDKLSRGIYSSHDCDGRVWFVHESIFKLHALNKPLFSSPCPCVLNLNTHLDSNVSVALPATNESTNRNRLFHFEDLELASYTSLIMDFEAFNNMMGNGEGGNDPLPAPAKGRPTREQHRTLGGKAWGESCSLQFMSKF